MKVERAKAHLEETRAAVQAFLDTKPYTVSVRADARAGRNVYYVSSVGQPGPEIAAAAGEVLQSLRSALDHLAYRLVSVGLGAPPPNPRVVAYPIADSAQNYPNLRDGRVPGVTQAAKAEIDATQPYRGGNDTLWRLNELSIIDRHRLLITVGSAFRSMDLGAYMSQEMKETFPGKEWPTLSAFFRPADRLFPLKEGDELFLDTLREKPREMQFRFDVAFGEAGVVEGEPLVETIQGMIDAVEPLVERFAPFV